ncbi:triphosphoribosyl-dephospho-CoA synthase [Halobellus ordinarius]|uniref:triphosphoribosyl-dephospho-CoA synthase n=1 Tax=Halobellus ordinarius TaxID=3075120 RepID=UPI00288020C6|nr:triphosphoribosyl-dephospho-CoA synthase [Halobellus sp. ZY16]
MTGDCGGRGAKRSPAGNAQLALLLDVAAAPKPGNVDRDHDLADLRIEHFLAGAVGAGAGLRRAAAGAPVGVAFERAVAGMGSQAGDNTQFGALLLLVPLVRAAAEAPEAFRGTDARGTLQRTDAAAVVEETTVADAADFYRAFEHVDVAVADPPEGMDALDVRRGADAIPAVRERGLTLSEILARSEGDGNATEWTTGFERTFETAAAIQADDGPLPDRIARAFVDRLANESDTLVRTRHGPEVAADVRRRATEARGDPEAVANLDTDLREAGINPGTTADLVTAATFVALERGVDL